MYGRRGEGIQELSKSGAAVFFSAERVEHVTIHAGSPPAHGAQGQWRMQRKGDIERASPFCVEQPPMVIVVVVALEKVTFVEVPVPLQVAFEHGPWPAIHRFTTVHLSSDAVDDFRRLDRLAA